MHDARAHARGPRRSSPGARSGLGPPPRRESELVTTPTRVVTTPFLRCALRTYVSSVFGCVLQFAAMRCEPAF